MGGRVQDGAGTSPKVTVVVPVYNEEAFLAQCLDTLLAQTLADIEVLCVDDGSTDASPAILARYAQGDARVRVISQENAGPAAARNRAAAEARGEYLYFFDSDDFCEPGLLEAAVQAGDRYEADLVALPFKLFNQSVGTAVSVAWSLPRWQWPEGAFTWRANPDAAFSTFRTVPWNKLVRTSFLRAEGIRFQEDVRLSEDVMFSLPAVVLARRIACVDEALLYHREGVGASAMDTKDSRPLDFIAAFAALRGFLEEHAVMGELRRAYVNWVAGGCAYNLFTLRQHASFAEVFDLLHERGLSELGLSEEDAALVDDASVAAALRALVAGDREGVLYREQARLRGEFDLSCYRERLQIERAETLAVQVDALEARLASEREALAALRDLYERRMNAAEQKVGQVVCYIPRLIQRLILRALHRGE